MRKTYIFVVCIAVLVGIVIGAIGMTVGENRKEDSILKMYNLFGETWTVNLDNPPGVIPKLEMDPDMALKIGSAILDSFYCSSYDTTIYPEDSIITEICDTDLGYYVVLRYNKNFLDGESGVVISKEDGRIHRIWICD